MPPRRAFASDSGFVLVGVVVFVLALTILVLSLYGLSSYEAQFLQRSLDSEQAFQSAVGGIERAKFALARTSQLLSVRENLPLENVIAAVAIQVQNGDSVSTGLLDTSPTCAPVLIRVTAASGGMQRTVEGSYTLHATADYYKQLITTSGRITISPDVTDTTGTVRLSGDIWEGRQPPDLSWVQRLALPHPAPVAKEGVEEPAVADYLASPPATINPTPPLTPYSGGGLDLTLSGGTDPTLYRAPDGHANGGFSFFIVQTDPQKIHHITVFGRVVWVLAQGARFEDHVLIEPGDAQEACLVIVAGPNTNPTMDPADLGTGLRFWGGLRSTVPLILVSNGSVIIAHFNSPDPSTATLTVLPELGIYARDVELMGPILSSGDFLDLARPTGGPLDNSHLPYLSPRGYLPNASPQGNLEFRLIAGTWRAYPQ